MTNQSGGTTVKKRLGASLLLVFCFILMLPTFAYADAIVGPNDDFYTRHRDECQYLGQRFYANSKDGYVSIKKAARVEQGGAGDRER